jgi:LysM repeat protein
MKQHIVQPGETTTSIAAMHGLSVSKLLEVNPHKPRVVAMVQGQPRQVFASLALGETISVDCGCGK